MDNLIHHLAYYLFYKYSIPNFIKMANSLKYLLLLLILNSSTLGFSQEETTKRLKSKITHTVGIQYNPIFNRNLFSYDTRENIYAIRYGFGYKGMTIGLELSNHTFKRPYKGNTIKLGIYSRYTFLRTKSVNPFAELSGFYSNSKGILVEENLIQDGNDELTNTKIGYYLAPGLSIKLYKSKVSLDLMLKVTKEIDSELSYGTRFVPSYKINYHF